MRCDRWRLKLPITACAARPARKTIKDRVEEKLPCTRWLAQRASIALVVAALAACGSPTPKDEPPNTEVHGVESILTPINGSAADGKIRIVDKGDGISIMISLHNVPTIPTVPTNEYRIVFTERALCNSTNGFSAGAPWVPPGVNRDPMQLVQSFWATGEDLGWVEVHVSGVRASGENGFSGRGALIFNGTRLPPVLPGVPNNAVACAAFEPTRPFTLGD